MGKVLGMHEEVCTAMLSVARGSDWGGRQFKDAMSV